MDTKEESLTLHIRVDEMEIESILLESCKEIRDADDVQSRYDIIKRIKQCHPDKTDSKDKNDECIELLQKLKK